VDLLALGPRKVHAFQQLVDLVLVNVNVIGSEGFEEISIMCGIVRFEDVNDHVAHVRESSRRYQTG